MGEDENTSHDMPTHQRLSYAVILAQRPFNSPYRSPLKSMVAFPHTHTHTMLQRFFLPCLTKELVHALVSQLDTKESSSVGGHGTS